MVFFIYSQQVAGIQEFQEMAQEKATTLNTEKLLDLRVIKATGWSVGVRLIVAKEFGAHLFLSAKVSSYH